MTDLSRLAVCFLLCLLAGCGEPEPTNAPTPPSPSIGPELAPLPVNAVPLRERAKFALDRIRRGPEPGCAVLRVSNMHPVSLVMAQGDLTDMQRVTLELLDDAKLIDALTGPRVGDLNPWLGVMSVLMAIEAKPAELVVRWTRPVLDRPRDIALMRRATTTLTTVRDAAIADTALALLRAAPDDRIIAPKVLSHLALLGTPYREQALEIVLRQGGPFTWKKLPTQVARRASRRRVDPSQIDAMTWTAHRLEGAGPRPPASLPREQKFTWSGARIWTDPDILRLTLEDEERGPFRLVAFGGLSLEAAYGAGWMSSDVSLDDFVPTAALYFTGREPAAELRCSLATEGHKPYLSARAAEQTDAYREIDQAVYFAALHCMVEGADMGSAAENLERLWKLLRKAIGRRDPGVGDTPLPTEISRLLRGLGDPSVPETRAVLEHVLTKLRPLDTWQVCVEAAHDALIGTGLLTESSLQLMRGLAFGDSPADRGVALHLMKRARNPEYIPVLEEMLAQGRPVEGRTLWRTLMFLYSTVPGIEPSRVIGFVGRVEEWIRDEVLPAEGPARAASLASGLLDFGDAGGEALARLLGTEHRAHFVNALKDRQGVVPISIVKALLRPLDRRSPPGEVRAVMALAWRLFPASAAGYLKALERRVPKEARPLIEAALVRVRHRGPREAR